VRHYRLVVQGGILFTNRRAEVTVLAEHHAIPVPKTLGLMIPPPLLILADEVIDEREQCPSLTRSCRLRRCDITADLEGRTDMSRTSRDGRV
jgi:hypothetical protein